MNGLDNPTGHRKRGKRILQAVLIVNVGFGLASMMTGLDRINQINIPSLGEIYSSMAAAVFSFRVVVWVLVSRGMEWARKLAIGWLLVSLFFLALLCAIYPLELHTGAIKKVDGTAILWLAGGAFVEGWSLWAVLFSKNVSAFFRSRRHQFL
jgi:hypothetical protein